MKNKNGRRGKLLFVDDDPMVLSSLKRLFLRKNYNIEYAENGTYALKKAEEFLPDLILLDVSMPGMSGYEVCERLKDNPLTKDCMVLILTGRSSIEERLKGYSVKADDFLAKPFDPEELIARVNILLRLKKALDEANNAVTEKADFLARMSHEIRTPMNGVMGMTELLYDTPLTPLQKEYLESIKSSTDALLSVINSILDYSKLESGNFGLSSESFSLIEEVEAVSDLICIQTLKKGVEFNCIIDADVPEYIIGDSVRFRQVILNVAGNAAKYTEKGSVAVQIKILKLKEDRGLFSIIISDTGVGIPETFVNEIFGQYTRAELPSINKISGTGLGMSITKQIVEMMGGTVNIKSRIGKGSVFTIDIWMKLDKKNNKKFDKPEDLFLVYAGSNKMRILNLKENCKRRGIQFCNSENIKSLEQQIISLNKSKNNGKILFVCENNFDNQKLEKILDSNNISDFSLIKAIGFGEKNINTSNCRENYSGVLSFPIKKEAFMSMVMNTGIIKEEESAEKLETDSTNLVPNLKILIADDNKMNLKVIRTILIKAGHSVKSASNGIEAVSLFKENNFDIVFMDGKMPEMNGAGAVQLIRDYEKKIKITNSDFRKAVIIAFSASSSKKELAAFYNAGIDDFILKPAKSTKIQEVILRFFG